MGRSTLVDWGNPASDRKDNMTASNQVRGLWVPALTPFDTDLSVDPARFIAHCQWLLANGANGLAAFGTTSEANSLSMAERKSLLEALIEAGIAPSQLMPGTGCCALPDTVELTRHAVERGCAGVLLLPPFYYKGVSDDGVFASISETIQRVGDSRLRVYLYHIPPMAAVGFGLTLIERLLKAYPDTIAGLKDSSGDWSNTEAVITDFPELAVFPGAELYLLPGLRKGGAGCISASANVNPGGIRRLCDTWQEDDADAQQEQLAVIRRALQSVPMIPGLKSIIAKCRNDDAWATVRPPLRDLPAAAAKQMHTMLIEHQFDWPEI